MNRPDDTPLGFAFLDKPAGLTSHDVVAQTRRVLRTRRVGHAGTLDPMATGVLVLGIGRATRLLSLISDADKTYTATIRLGQSTTTDDAQGEALTTHGAAGLSDERIRAAIPQFTGRIEQRPSTISAVKVAGRRSYARARAGESPVLAARSITVHEFDVLGIGRTGAAPEFVDVSVRVRCGSGTYIRALARDLGDALGVGGHLTALRRVESFGIRVDECRLLADFVADPRVEPVRTVVGDRFPLLTAADATIDRIKHGQQVPLSEFAFESPSAAAEDAGVESTICFVTAPDGHVVAGARINETTLAPFIVLMPVEGR
ncbi:MAG: tRNA pseudouridine(55) synthase TruB [Actinobacteria bacterium]|nr:tRNA pseudouridine(55) synthase TruB [Actinomycetota bacterium]